MQCVHFAKFREPMGMRIATKFATKMRKSKGNVTVATAAAIRDDCDTRNGAQNELEAWYRLCAV